MVRFVIVAVLGFGLAAISAAPAITGAAKGGEDRKWT
jgi:hypothetical protein